MTDQTTPIEPTAPTAPTDPTTTPTAAGSTTSTSDPIGAGWPSADAHAGAASAVAASAVGASAALRGPRVRWGAIVWGLAFAAIAAVELWVLVDPARRDAASDWWRSLEPGMFLLVVLLAMGALLLVAGLAGVLRRASSR
ncbi:hypothetical protein ACDF64_07250 [Agromyces sp. MMS24-JH15]|uniref:hypothetical protein n=1 Tax=Agromyces sp. MMS24-JH15 TaxID=3243765 RepID=UPI00374A6D4C